MTKKTWVLLALLVLVLVGSYRNQLKPLFDKGATILDNGPTNEQAQQIFQGTFQKSIPIDWAGSMMGGTVESVAVTNVVRGKSLKEQNGGTLPPPYNSSYQDCWPVAMHVKGVSLANMIFNTQRHPFEEDTNFKLCKTYENKWQIFTDGRIMTNNGM
jgi:hypothetical protein